MEERIIWVLVITKGKLIFIANAGFRRLGALSIWSTREMGMREARREVPMLFIHSRMKSIDDGNEKLGSGLSFSRKVFLVPEVDFTKLTEKGST